MEDRTQLSTSFNSDKSLAFQLGWQVMFSGLSWACTHDFLFQSWDAEHLASLKP